MSYFRPHSAWDTKLAAQALTRLAANVGALASRSLRIDCYRHLLVCPSCTIATVNGTAVSFHPFQPLGVGEMLFRTTVYFAAIPAASDTDRQVAALYDRSVVGFNGHVFAEDNAVVEQVFRWCQHAAMNLPLRELARNEHRVRASRAACDHNSGD